jgi:hypothetical protein
MNLCAEATPVGDPERPSAAAPIGATSARAARSRADFRLFAGADADAFAPAADGDKEKRPGAGAICGPAFLFPPAWFLYRKMCRCAAFTVLAPVLVTLVQPTGGIMGRIDFGLSFVGTFGNRLYVAKARRMIAEIRAGAPDETVARETISRAGGPSPAGAVIGDRLMGAFAAFRFLET